MDNQTDKPKLFDYKVPVPMLIVLGGLVIIAAYGLFRPHVLSYTINLPAMPAGSVKTFEYGAVPALSNPDFFGQVRNQFIDEKSDFIEADLTKMVVRVYKSGIVEREFPILTKGREGSWWETPAGLYKVLNKESNHFSSIGRVNMPWSLNFQGNFYIHGETYYPNGSLVDSSFTGGCIKLRTADARDVYKMVEIGTPLLVFEQSFAPDGYSYTDQPSLDAPIYMAADLRSNHIFATSKSTNVVPIASITKLMTALVATEFINLDNMATVPKTALVYTSKPRLKSGEQHSVYQLLFPLLMESSNEAAETIASSYGRTAFIRHMNEKAAAIGMTHTKFADPSGISADNISSAEDLFMLAKYIYNNRSFIFAITSGKLLSSVYGTAHFENLENFNDFTDNQYFVGGKNGKSTAAQESNLTVLEFPVNGTKTRPVAFIVLSSPSQRTDTEKLISHTVSNLPQGITKKP